MERRAILVIVVSVFVLVFVFVLIFVVVFLFVAIVVMPVAVAGSSGPRGDWCGVARLGGNHYDRRCGGGVARGVRGGVSDGVDASGAGAGAFRAQEEGANVGAEGNGAAADGLYVIGLIAVARSVVRFVAGDGNETDRNVCRAGVACGNRGRDRNQLVIRRLQGIGSE